MVEVNEQARDQRIDAALGHLGLILDLYTITQKEIADDMGMAFETLSRILNHWQKPQELTLRALEGWLVSTAEDYPLDAEKPV